MIIRGGVSTALVALVLMAIVAVISIIQSIYRSDTLDLRSYCIMKQPLKCMLPPLPKAATVVSSNRIECNSIRLSSVRMMRSTPSRSSCQAYQFSPDISGSSCPGQMQVFSDSLNPDKLYWKSSYQNPGHMVWGVSSKPWFDPLENDICCSLEENHEKIRLELDRVLEAQKESDTAPLLSPIGSREGEASLVSNGGNWSDFILLDDGTDSTQKKIGKYSPQDLCPHTVNMLKGLEGVSNAVTKSKIGVAMFSCLTPGTYLKPHCGPINIRLTCHLGLIIPENVNIRVGDEWRTWEEGKCLLFDDSFEHEVKHDGDRERIVLLTNLWHPNIRKENWEPLARQARQARQTRVELQEYFNRQISRRSNKRLPD
mmetsp:Transcript_289/g.437  ORF Transcript_289/g.437 Transcript_289/m.437 type:complete len:370 (-) Transcript_289:201-1310(-)